MKKLFKIISILVLFVLLLSPNISSAQYDDNYDPTCPTGDYDNCFGNGGGGSNNDNGGGGNNGGGSTVGCTLPSSAGIGDMFAHITCIIYKSLIPMFFALATAMFIFGVIQYVISGADETKKDKGKQYMVWGIIGLTVMVSVWGLVALLGSTFGLDTSVVPQVPQ